MPFAIPMLVGAGATAMGIGTIGSALLSAGASFGLAYLAKRMTPEPRESTRVRYGARLSLRLDPNDERDVILGRAATAGSLKYHHKYGPNGNDYIQLVYALADHECDGLEEIWVDGKKCTFGDDVTSGGTTGVKVTEFNNLMWVRFHSGALDQAADADLVAKGGTRWTSTERGAGVCYVRVTMLYSQSKFPNGLPKLMFVVRGLKCYDIRKDTSAGGSGSHRWGTPSTYEWTDNPVILAYNWRRGVYVGTERLAGMSTVPAMMPYAVWGPAASVCDETVALKAGGTEKRYRAGGVVSTGTENREVIRDLLTAMAGAEIDTGGLLRPQPGVAQTSVMTVTDADLIADAEVEIIPKLPRNDLANAVFGACHDPAQAWESVALPPRISPDDEAADGGIHLPKNYALDFVASLTQGQRVMEIMRRRERHQRRVRCRLRSRFAALEAGDWITWTSARYGFEAVKFEVLQATLNTDLTVTVSLRETSATIYAWTPATDELDATQPQEVPAGGSTFATVDGVALAAVTITGDSGSNVSTPGLTVSWTPVTDGSCVALRLEFRRVGDTVAIERRIEDPASGTYTWVEGVQGQSTYEARLLPVVLPVRPVTWSGWAAVPSATANQVVNVSNSSQSGEASIADGSVTPIKLSAQARFELSLVTALATQPGSTAEALAAAFGWAEQSAEAAMRALLMTDEMASRIETVETIVADGGLAQRVTTLETTKDGHSARLVELEESRDGVSARWGVAVDIDGNIVGAVQLDGSASESTFTVLADTFRVAQPSVVGGDPVPVFVLANVEGTPRLVLRGDMIADGTITARHFEALSLSSISADIGEITSGRLRRADNRMRIDLDNMEIVIESGAAP